MVLDVVVLPLLVQLSHIDQTVLHLLQTPDLLPSTPTSNLNCWFTEHCIPLHTHTHTDTQTIRELALKTGNVCMSVHVFMCERPCGLRWGCPMGFVEWLCTLCVAPAPRQWNRLLAPGGLPLLSAPSAVADSSPAPPPWWRREGVREEEETEASRREYKEVFVAFISKQTYNTRM